MKIKKIMIIFITVVLFSAAYAGCGSRTMSASAENSIIEISNCLYAGYSWTEERIGLIQQAIQESEKELKETVEAYTGLIFTFHLEDFNPEEILCENILKHPLNGKENPELLALYAEVGKEPEYLYYAEFDFEEDGDLDYIVVYSLQETAEDKNICGCDIWLYREGKNNSNKLILGYRRIEMPQLYYLTGGSWQEPELFAMVLRQGYYDYEIEGIGAYKDATMSEMILTNIYSDRLAAKDFITYAEDSRGKLIIEERIYKPFGAYDNAWVRMTVKRENEEDFSQVIYTIRLRYNLLNTKDDNIVIWDANEDGHEDILYYQGYDGGSGGIFEIYSLYNWSEEEKQYVEVDFPSCTDIDYETHKVFSRGQSGVAHQIYMIYAVKDGEWELYKRLDLIYELGEVDQAVYYEWGEEIEITDITGLSWEEEKALLEEKYPEFNFWREG